MKVALYPGTFNPIHIGHLTVINYAIEIFQIDLLYIIPNKYPVHKKRKYLIDPELRLKMIQLSIENMLYKSKISVSDFEVKSNLDSYTFITVEHFRKIHQNDDIYLIVGLDSLLFYYWQNFELIYKLVNYFILINNMFVKENLIDFMKKKLDYLRSNELEHNKELINIIEYNIGNVEEKFLILDIPSISISSSLIWDRIENRKSIDYWVNDKVKNILYKIVPLGGNKRYISSQRSEL